MGLLQVGDCPENVENLVDEMLIYSYDLICSLILYTKLQIKNERKMIDEIYQKYILSNFYMKEQTLEIKCDIYYKVLELSTYVNANQDQSETQEYWNKVVEMLRNLPKYTLLNVFII